MSRRLPGALALTFVLAAATAPAYAAGPTLDTTFGTDGFASTTFGERINIGTPVTTAAADGSTVTGAIVTAPFRSPERAAQEGEPGLNILRYDAAGRPTGTTVLPNYSWNQGLSDIRKLADGRIVAAGTDDTAVFAVVVAADGTTRQRSFGLPQRDCGWAADVLVHPSGQIVAAWECNGRTDLRVYDVDDAAGNRGTVTPPTTLDRTVRDLALAPDGDVVLRADLPELLGRGAASRASVGRVDIGTRSWSFDAGFGDGGWAGSPIGGRITVDSAGRPVVAEYDRGDGVYRVARFEATDGDLDPQFGTAGVAEVPTEQPEEVDALATDTANRVTVTGHIWGDNDRRIAGVLRLTDRGVLDTTFGTDGIWVFETPGQNLSGFGTTGVPGGTIATYTTGSQNFAARRLAVPSTPGIAAVTLVKIVEPFVPQPPQAPGTSPQTPAGQPTPTPTPITTVVESRSPRTARTCVSRRVFIIRLRPRTLKSAKVTVAGKRTKVSRLGGRLTAQVDLRKLAQASFKVVVTGRTAKGKAVRETRTYRTCRVGEDGPKVKGGSVVITLSR